MTDSPRSEFDSLANIPSGTVTFLFTDIQGSTQLLERLREQYANVLAEQRDVLRAVFATWNGHEIDTQGDAFFVAFPRALDAVNCAVEAQRALSKHTWPQNIQVYVRMGLHTGEPVIARTGYVGMDVHLAARIGAAGHGGQVLLSDTTRGLIHNDLPHGVRLRDLGEHKLKDIRHAQHIYQVEIDGLPREFPPLKTLATDDEPPTPGNPPFKGLQFFAEDDAELFFGREAVTAQLVDRFQAQRFLAIIGASGSGKSSVVRAGVVPRLRRQLAVPWNIHVITPTAHPLEALATSLTHTAGSLTATTTLIDDLAHDPRCLHLFSRQYTPASRLVVIVDQFEELFTLCRGEAERQAFVDNLLYAQAADGSRTTLVVVLRADFYEHLAQYATLREAVARHQEYLGPMTAAELREAIEEPAKRGGWEFSPGLVDLMLHDVGATAEHQPEPGALPLLSHALLETWRRRRGNVMTLKGYSESGGVRGAIAHTAETVFYTELTAEQRPIARGIFLRLTELGEGTQDTRRRAALEELFPLAPFASPTQVEDVLVKLADARLITTGEGTVEVAHEALIREWSTLREWLTQNREGLRLHRHLTEAAQEWELLERDTSLLYRGTRLAQAVDWAAANPHELNAREQIFLDASQTQAVQEEAEREVQRRRELEAARKLAETEHARADSEQRRADEQRRSANRLRARNRALAVAGALVTVAAVAAIIFGGQANANATRADQNAQQAQANAATAQAANEVADQQRSVAVESQATAVAESQIRATQQAIAQTERDQAETEKRLATARELAAAAISNLNSDPERSILLALQSVTTTYAIDHTALPEAENALHQAVGASRIVVTLRGTSIVWKATFSPDGTRLATANDDMTAKIWDASTGKELLTLKGHTDVVESVAFSPDGKRLVTGSDDKTARIWDAVTGQMLRTMTGHTDALANAIFSPDGTRLATASVDGTVKVWNATTGQELLTLPGGTADVAVVAFSPDGTKLASVGEGNVANVWDTITGQKLMTLSGHTDLVWSIAFSPDGTRLATTSRDRIVKIWNAQDGKELLTLYGHTDSITGVAFSHDSTRLATSGYDHQVIVWDAHTGQELFALKGHSDLVWSVAFSPDDKQILTASSDRTARIWDITPSREFLTLVNGPASSSAAPAKAVYSSDGTRLFASDADKTPKVWDATTGKLLFSLAGHTDIVRGIARSNDGTRIATASDDKTAKIWDANTGHELLTLSGHTDVVSRVTFSPDGTRVATASFDGTAKVWDTATGKVLATLSGHKGWVGNVAFSPDGKRIITGGFDGTARVWDAATGKELLNLDTHHGFVLSVAFSPDGTRLATGGFDSTARVWDSLTGTELMTLTGHAGNVYGVIFSPDGTKLATASDDKTAKIWDAVTGKELLTLYGHSNGVTSVDFSPDGSRLVTASFDGTDRVYLLHIQDLVELARSRVTRALTTEECQKYLHVDACPAAQ